jgi:hypothetical protein
MRIVLGLLPALGCGAVLFACVRMMTGHGKGQPAAKSDSERELTDLREEVARLRSDRPVAGGDSPSSPAPMG